VKGTTGTVTEWMIQYFFCCNSFDFNRRYFSGVALWSISCACYLCLCPIFWAHMSRPSYLPFCSKFRAQARDYVAWEIVNEEIYSNERGLWTLKDKFERIAFFSSVAILSLCIATLGCFLLYFCVRFFCVVFLLWLFSFRHCRLR